MLLVSCETMAFWDTPPKTNMSLKRDYFNRKYIFQPLTFRGHVSFLGSILDKRHHRETWYITPKENHPRNLEWLGPQVDDNPKIPVMFSEKNNNLVEFHILPGNCTDIFHPVTLISSKKQQQLFTQIGSIFFFRRYNWMPCYNLNATRILLVLGNDEASHIPNLIGKGLAWIGACDSTSRVTALGNPENARWVFQVRKGPSYDLLLSIESWLVYNRDPYIGLWKSPYNWVV